NVALKSAPPPFNYILMAAAIAQGFANVANIESTNQNSSGKGGGTQASPPAYRATPPTGFDDPLHDQIAYIGGRRWAEDVLRHMSTGAREVLTPLAFGQAGFSDGLLLQPETGRIGTAPSAGGTHITNIDQRIMVE